jgi:hypothetical protein
MYEILPIINHYIAMLKITDELEAKNIYRNYIDILTKTYIIDEL